MKNGYDPFIDFLKGWSILMVILTHALPNSVRDLTFFSVWGGCAVPLFLLIQVFHTYKKGLDSVNPFPLKKIFKRIINPFLIVSVIALALRVALQPTEALIFVKYALKTGGGAGPGSYYVWIYVEFALLLAVLKPLFRRCTKWQLLVGFILACELLEIGCSLVHLNQSVYRLLPFRYLYLLFLGYEWVKEGVVLTWWNLCLSWISLAGILVLNYSSSSFSPWVFDTDCRCYHWFTYYYAAYLLPWVLYQVYQLQQRYWPSLNQVMRWMGKYSFEIYLLQMLYFSFLY
jgi:peptidoglycan/LPS O-acetylase OafA/YrhL